ncbi:MAG: flagellar export chaperone FlgN [Anaerolineaceae bacterium]|nr:flagellar export chaperone FlgN [Anaerolineaceae bacterium]
MLSAYTELDKKDKEELIEALEASLVKLFRLCQSLFTLTKNERQILVESNEVDELDDLASKKVIIIEEIEKTENSRKEISGRLSKVCGFDSDFDTLSELIESIDLDNKVKFTRLQEGILTLQSDIRELNEGNYALATLNLQHLKSVQEFIINTINPPTSYYGPKSQSKDSVPPTTWQMDQQV